MCDDFWVFWVGDDDCDGVVIVLVVELCFVVDGDDVVWLEDVFFWDFVDDLFVYGDVGGVVIVVY